MGPAGFPFRWLDYTLRGVYLSRANFCELERTSVLHGPAVHPLCKLEAVQLFQQLLPMIAFRAPLRRPVGRAVRATHLYNARLRARPRLRLHTRPRLRAGTCVRVRESTPPPAPACQSVKTQKVAYTFLRTLFLKICVHFIHTLGLIFLIKCDIIFTCKRGLYYGSY